MADTKSTTEIVGEWRHRQTERGVFFERCRIISQHYDNEVPLPLPDLGAKEAPAVANLLAQGVDQHANRIASYMPDVQAFPVKLGDPASEKRADKRRRSSIGFWENNSYDLIIRKRARWLVAYAESPVMIVPDKKLGGPKWVIRTPLETYPAAMDPTEMQPKDCLFAVQRTVGWLKSHYPGVDVSGIRLDPVTKYSGERGLTDDDTIDIVEWRSATETVLLCVGEGYDPAGLIHEAEYGIQDARIINLGPAGPGGGKYWTVELQRVPNTLGMCPVVVPGRISLGRTKGQFDDTTGLYVMQAKLAAMEVNAVANGIWPDEWLVAAADTTPEIIRPADGRKGIVGIAQGGTFVNRQIQPGLQTPTTIDRLEREQRITAGIPPDFGGESGSNIRTGRRGDSLLSSAVDYTIQEHQQILARSGQHELEIAAAVDLTYFGDTKKSFYVSWKNGKGRLDYTPKDIWTEDRTLRVNYAKPGADINTLDVTIGQGVGVGILSKLTGMRMHPDVKDPEYEHGQIIFEGLEAAALNMLQQEATGQGVTLIDLANIADAAKSGKDLFQAIADAHQAAQERQSSTVQPAEPGTPEAQPGLSPPGAGAEAGGPIPAPAPSQQNLVALLRGLRTGGQISAQGAPS